jgi:hypothetical protein
VGERTVLTLDTTMAKAKRPVGRPKSSTRQDVSIKFDKVLVSRARVIANGLGIPLAQYISEASRAVIDRDYAKLMRKLEGER